eukprot:TRINITY_DN57394_c0_g1_i1.p1 TRINITY_DN57394_c0_g1~~TRINITY_DN57394_c0_g1_i1.p1  ORF type:complete len:227 (+),score=46.76 TRINITY_DN57394_c0_g1_i1:66-746(+)
MEGGGQHRAGCGVVPAAAEAGSYGALCDETAAGASPPAASRRGAALAALVLATLGLLATGIFSPHEVPLASVIIKKRWKAPPACYEYSESDDGSVASCTDAGLIPVQSKELCEAAAYQLGRHISTNFTTSPDHCSELPVGCFSKWNSNSDLHAHDLHWNPCANAAANYSNRWWWASKRYIICQNATAWSLDGADCKYDTGRLHNSWLFVILYGCCWCLCCLLSKGH